MTSNYGVMTLQTQRLTGSELTHSPTPCEFNDNNQGLSFLEQRIEAKFSFLPFAFGLFGRRLGLKLLLFILKQLRKHLLEAVDRFLLSTNHIELLSLGLGLLFKAPSHFFKSACHIREGFFLYRRVRGL